MKTYDPKDITVVFSGILITGYADGTFCEIDREADAFTDVAGAGGEVARARTQDRRGTIKVTLMMTSPTNDLLSATAAVDESTGNGVGEIMVKDNNGTSIASGSESWIMKKPAKVYAKEIESLEWRIRVANLVHIVGGTAG